MKRGQYDPKTHADALYHMYLHESLRFDKELCVTRVPAGWV